MPLKTLDLAEQIKNEHECLKRDLGVIRENITREAAAENFAEWRLEFMWRLRDFKNHLLKHFDLEEEGGFMSEILQQAPEAANQVKKLEAEHGEILSRLDGILADLKGMEVKEPSRLEDIRHRVLQWIALMHAHEETENKLIQKVYYQVYGYPAG